MYVEEPREAKKTRPRGHSRSKSLSDKNDLIERDSFGNHDSQHLQQIEELQFKLKAAEASSLNNVLAVFEKVLPSRL